MAQITEPVTTCTIIFRYLHWTPDRKGTRYYNDKFQSVQGLKDYFTRFPAAGALVGYGKARDGAVFAFEAQLILEWTDQTTTVTKSFATAREFVSFLQEHPALANAIEYEGN